VANTILLFRIDIGFDRDKGYAAVVADVRNERMKGIKGNSMQQITSRLRNVLNEEAAKQKQFPLEHEHGEPSRIITPNGFST
jgi:hypothetical protein